MTTFPLARAITMLLTDQNFNTTYGSLKNYCYPKDVYTMGLKLSFKRYKEMRNLRPRLTLKLARKMNYEGRPTCTKKIEVDLPQLMVINTSSNEGI